MAKRLTDTDKWKDDWYLSLSNDDKIVWQWLLDNCNHSGVCKRSVTLLNLMCRVNYTEEKMLSIMEDRILVKDNIWFIPKFIKFQYPTLLSAKPAIFSVVKDLFQYGLIDLIPKSFGNDYSIISKSYDNHCKMIKDMVKDKDTVKDTVIVKEGDPAISFSEDRLSAIFKGGKMQKLGEEQLEIARKNNFSKPQNIKFGSTY